MRVKLVVLCAIILNSGGLILSKTVDESAKRPFIVTESTTSGTSFLSWNDGALSSPANLLRPGQFVHLGGNNRVVAKREGEDLVFSVSRDEITSIRHELVFPFNPSVTPVTVLPSLWREDGKFQFPALINAPDYGMLKMTCSMKGAAGRLDGSRDEKYVNLVVELPQEIGSSGIQIRLAPYVIHPPTGISENDELWQLSRKGWCNTFQPASQWGPADKPFSARPGLLANNVISDPVSFALWPYSDAMRWMPEIAEGISVAPLVRRTLEYWMDERTTATGECVGYWAYFNFLDSNPSLLISAWNYVEATGDKAWLQGRIEKLEKLAEFLAGRDVDHDGMVEATQTGNRNGLHEPNRSSNWWDAVNCGWKDGYANAVIYRGWRCLADLEKQLGRTEKAERYRKLADRLKAVYARELLNPKTGWLGWWKSQDGELHDYATLIVNPMAIEYGLVDLETGRKILASLRKKMDEVGFTKHELGTPCFLVPVNRSDYLQPNGLGCPQKEDGTDSFQHYMNGGVTGGHAYHWIAAHYLVGEKDYADSYLKKMLQRQAEGKFQTGVTDRAPDGGDWTTWEGKPCGYEGYLSDNFRFIQTIMLRNGMDKIRAYEILR